MCFLPSFLVERDSVMQFSGFLQIIPPRINIKYYEDYLRLQTTIMPFSTDLAASSSSGIPDAIPEGGTVESGIIICT
jgi:hypothetical protein